jgi:hypothetical protein
MGIADLLDQLDIKEPLPSYSPTLYRITGGKGEAVALAQLIYKCANSNWGTVRMSSSDWAAELQLSRREFENLNNCITTLCLGTIEVVYIGYVKKLAYTLYKQAIIEALKDGNVIYDVRNKLRIVTSEVTHSNVTNDVPIRNKLRTYTSEVTHIKEIKSNKSNEEIKEPLTETSSVVPDGLFKFDRLKELAEQAIGKNEQAKPKNKKPKEPTDELTAEIHKYVCEAHDYLKKWHEAKYESPMLTYDKDFKNLKDTFRKLIEGSVNFEEAKRITAQKCFNGVKYFVDNFDKLDSFDQKKFSLNHIATNWKALKESIQKYKAPVAKPNTFDTPPVVSVKLPSIYNGVPLPIGIEVGQFRELSKEVYRDKVMEGIIDDANTSLIDFMQAYQYELRKLSPEQLKQLLNDYGII